MTLNMNHLPFRGVLSLMVVIIKCRLFCKGVNVNFNRPSLVFGM